MSQILDLLWPGDILTHCYSGFPNLAGDFTNIVQDGHLLPAALAAKQRGVVFDIGHGGGSFDYTVAEAAIQQGCPPDTISSDIIIKLYPSFGVLAPTVRCPPPPLLNRADSKSLEKSWYKTVRNLVFITMGPSNTRVSAAGFMSCQGI
jgi:hypothetical protein